MPTLVSLRRLLQRWFCTALLATAVAWLPAPAQSGQFSGLVVFGDSLSDTGNLLALTSRLTSLGVFPTPYPPDPPYVQGRFSNGPVWIEQLAERLGFDASASGASLGPLFGDHFVPVAGGRNFAVAAARTGTSGLFESFGLPVPTGLQTQVGLFLGQNGGTVPDGNALYVVVAGGNNIRDAALMPDKALRDAVAINAATAYRDAIARLIDGGARTILVANASDLGKTPEALFVRHNAAAASDATHSFNTALTPLLARLEADKGVQLLRLDLYGLLDAVHADATRHGGQAFGLTNTTVPCLAGFAGSPGADCRVSLYSDDLHPTTALHSLLARAAAACRVGTGGYLADAASTDPDILTFSRFCSRNQSP
ncbi:SGNH/GDSL hydrolase family protein [Pseudogulbenkiania sp. MAI-1]|uniref:SGNH/GDSL hydrolase family protein n=1 Tax=Pseudogulbenkiania sp. MAI-1 TaxID=990370 RepID=UPI00045EA9AB|nr:SGNH/GDSL hydrolase family protein [Pseudogulbenkiania sp. MAI-1]